MSTIIQAQAMINGKKTFFVTRAKDVYFKDNITLEDKVLGSGTSSSGVDEDEVNALISKYMNGITFNEENVSDLNDEIPDIALDPEIQSYIDNLFNSLNDIIVFVPANSWTWDGTYYQKKVIVEELTGDEYPIISVISGSNDNNTMTTDEISDSLRDISIEDGYIVIKTNKKITAGFKLILKGINVPGGTIIDNYNKLATDIESLNDRMDINDILVDVTTDDWIIASGAYSKTIEVEGITSNQNLFYTLFNSPSSEAQKLGYQNITNMVTNDNSITITSIAIPTENYKLILKSALVTNGTVPGSYSKLEDKIEELETEVNNSNKISITDKYKSFDGKASDRIVPSSYALFMVYSLLSQKYTNVKNQVNTVFDNHRGKLNVITKSGWCRITGTITFSDSSYIPLTILNNLPKPISVEYTNFMPNTKAHKTDKLSVVVNTEGVLTVDNGTLGETYRIEISYPYEEEE